jgi:ferredoxin
MRASTTVDLARRCLLGGGFDGKRPPVRPPWALAEADFTGSCDRCKDCVEVCPVKAVEVRAAGK